MTLNQTWAKCLKQWRYIVKEIKGGSGKSVEELKCEWFRDNDPNSDAICSCYFCEYTRIRGSCESCPARKVAPRFHCMSKPYHYYCQPVKFLAKLEQLNKKRLGKS